MSEATMAVTIPADRSIDSTAKEQGTSPDNLCLDFENEITSKKWYSIDEKNADEYYTAVGVGWLKKLAANVAIGTEFKGE